MRTKLFALCLLLLTGSIYARAAEPAQAALQKGLLEEEVNINLPAAIEAYQAVLIRFEEQRKIAATATFRLGECYRKMGKTNQANAQFQQVVNNFAEQTNLVKLSQAELHQENSARFQTRLNQIVRRSDGADSLEDEDAKEIQRLQEMIKNSPDLINSPAKGTAPLEDAAVRGRLSVARFLLDNGASVKGSGEGNETPLHGAVFNGHRAMVELLLERGAPVDAPNRNGETPLYYAAKKGFQVVAQVLLSKGAKVNAPRTDGNTPLHGAVFNSQLAMVDFLLANQADLNAVGAEGMTALIVAAARKDRAIVDQLLAHHAEVNIKDKSGQTALTRSIRESGFGSITQKLLDAGADPNVASSFQGRNPEGSETTWKESTPLFYAAVEGNTSAVEQLLKHQAEVNAQNDGGNTALHIAVRFHLASEVSLLLAHGADPNIPNGNAQVPIQEAIESVAYNFSSNGPRPGVLNSQKVKLQDEIDLIKELIAHGARVDPNWTPSFLALVHEGRTSVMSLLLDHGADVNRKHMPQGYTLLHVAAAANQTNMIQILLSRKADVNAQDTAGNTPLHYAAINHHADAVLMLIEHGANRTLPNRDGQTPAEFVKLVASSRGQFVNHDWGIPVKPALTQLLTLNAPLLSPDQKQVIDLLERPPSKDP